MLFCATSIAVMGTLNMGTPSSYFTKPPLPTSPAVVLVGGKECGHDGGRSLAGVLLVEVAVEKSVYRHFYVAVLPGLLEVCHHTVESDVIIGVCHQATSLCGNCHKQQHSCG